MLHLGIRLCQPLGQARWFASHIVSHQLWFYASDVPKRKPYTPDYKPTRSPQKFLAFSQDDCERLEAFYQSWASSQTKKSRVPVNEDLLFNVDLANMELNAAYWDAPTYEVRRGIWFDSQDRPLSAELTEELEKFRSQLDFDSPEELQNDVCKFTRTYEEGNLVVFVDKKTAYILQDMDGGDLQLNLIRANISSPLLLKGTKIFRSDFQDLHHGSKNKVDHRRNQLGKISELITWEVLDLFGINAPKTKELESQRENDILEREIESDYDNQGPSNSRDINHLVLCVHGIGQTLGKKYEYVNFAHTINQLRTHMKKIYDESPSLQELNHQNGFKDWKNNCNVQVLPITWRHEIGFKTDATAKNPEDPSLPTLSNITVNGVLGLRRLLGDVALDILLYSEPHYKEKIKTQVTRQINETYHRFKERTPGFGGKVHLIGHSLGSLILWDILSEQHKYKLDFDVNNFFCVGSPIGVFKLIQRSKIGSSEPQEMENLRRERPSCDCLYNLFHVCDPIAYRLEPLVDARMAQYEQRYLPHRTGESITSKMLEIGGSLWKEKHEKSKKNMNKRETLDPEIASRLTDLNYTGRLDYSLPPGFLEVDFISAAKAHISYFEDMDIANFLLKEILSNHQRAEEIVVEKLQIETG
ncbi:hypothetical protein ZYGR_0H00310 [Zygosaccharomyces rouxii]|uniref:ZYRO0B04752p n=2 Tax=Zygosaccharomyces rouxii TaxID=4956 RepID=C5DR13_ZYGRC|nr:uncharacterized protein ZYRO0B04752g [Zygosaccharomyces rouxii]KAH9200230.1 DDHD domain-containing protein [Zygosaccharomyces rouxii]GAV47191.1 hypothetical protein ZYGR_0H00310 [Zygosaccharomyces rouxii]CAR26224.1 ZYRO0B04752p [Zygosaccharomyces rouxii]